MTIITDSKKLKELLSEVLTKWELKLGLMIDDERLAILEEVLKFAIEESEGNEQMAREHEAEAEEQKEGYASVKDATESQDDPMTEAEKLGATQDRKTGEWQV